MQTRGRGEGDRGECPIWRVLATAVIHSPLPITSPATIHVVSIVAWEPSPIVGLTIIAQLKFASIRGGQRWKAYLLHRRQKSTMDSTNGMAGLTAGVESCYVLLMDGHSESGCSLSRAEPAISAAGLRVVSVHIVMQQTEHSAWHKLRHHTPPHPSIPKQHLRNPRHSC